MYGLKEKFLEYVKNLDSDFLASCGLVDLFYDCCMERKPFDNSPDIKARFQTIDAALQSTTLQDNNKIFSLLMEQCQSYGEAGFYAGFETAVKFLAEARFWLNKE